MEERIHVFNLAYPDTRGGIAFKEGDLLDYSFARAISNGSSPTP
jgi:hypothetical protein